MQSSQPKVVLFCNQSASTIGGVEAWLDQLCQGLDRRQWRPLVALVRGSKENDPDRFKSAHPNLETIEIDGRGLGQEGRVRAVLRCIERVRPAVFVPLVVADAHEAGAHFVAGGGSSRYLLALHGTTPAQLLDAKRLLPCASLAVAPGALGARLLKNFGMPAERVRYIPNGVYPPLLARRPRGIGQPLRLGYVGRLTEADKRVRDLVPFLKQLTDKGVPIDLTIAGDGPELPYLQAALAGYPVRFLGAVSRERLYGEIYPELDVLLLFSESEAFGIVLLEAMVHGVVPVSSAFVGCSSEAIVEDCATGLLFPVGDVECAARSVERLAMDVATLDRLSAAAVLRVSGQYAWKECVAAWEEALQSSLDLPMRATQSWRPSGPAAPPGRLDRIGFPAGAVDKIRRLRLALFGVPDAFVGGEEWPWATRNYDRETLAEMAVLRNRLESAEGGNA